MSNARAGFLHQSLLWKILAKSSKRRLCLLADWGVKVMVMSDMMVMSVMSNTMVTFDMMVMSDMNGHDSHDTESQDGNVCHDGHVWHDGHDHYDHPRHHHCSFPPWDLLNLPG